VDTRRTDYRSERAQCGEVTACGQTAKYGQKIFESGTPPDANYAPKPFLSSPLPLAAPVLY